MRNAELRGSHWLDRSHFRSTSAYNSAFHSPHSAFRIPFVNWLDAVDATYRTDLRELNELNFARFDAKLEQRLAQVKSDLVKWMFVFWAPTALGLIGASIGVINLLLRR